MRILKILISIFILIITNSNLFPQQVIELKIPKSEKVVIKLMFRNGSISDPVGKEGLTYVTAHFINNGGTKDFTYKQIQEKLFPMAAAIGVTVDKEVTIFTFQIPRFFLNDFYLF
jgi:zinc protease